MRARAKRCTLTESGTRHELPDDQLSADRVRELLKLEPNQTCGFVRVSYVSADVALGDAEVLAKKYPPVAKEIRSFPQPTSGVPAMSSANLSRLPGPVLRA